MPVEIILTAGQRADVTQAEALVKDHQPEAVLADKAFDSDAFIAALRAKGAQVVIPPKANRVEQRAFDHALYKERNLVERFMNRIKQYRRVATRYDKKAQNFWAFVQVAAIMVLLA